MIHVLLASKSLTHTTAVSSPLQLVPLPHWQWKPPSPSPQLNEIPQYEMQPKQLEKGQTGVGGAGAGDPANVPPLTESSMPHSFTPLAILNRPPSPHSSFQEFLISQ